MIIKKTEKADLEKYRGLFLKVGFIIALEALFMAFEWTSKAETVESFGKVQDVNAEEEIIPITHQDIAPPPPPQQQQVTDILNVAEDDADIEEEAEVTDMESDESTQIEIQELPEEKEEKEETIFAVVEDMPKFPGGDIGLQRWIAKHVNYPAIARENDIQGKVILRFVVNSTGKVDKVQIIRGVDPLLNAEAIRVVKMLPRWKPGYQRNKPVSVW